MLFCIALLGISPIFAQPCAIDQPEGNAFLNISDATAVGQTFTACGTGYVTAIEVNFYIQTVNTLTLQMSAGNNTLSPQYSQTFEANSTGKTLIQLTTPFAVQDLQTYTFTVVGLAGSGAAGALLGLNGNPYTGGNAITETGGAVTNFGTDLTFGLTIVTDACVIDQPDNNAFANVSTTTAVGQTFTACKDGAITMIRMNFSTLNVKALKLQISSGANTLTPEYTQDFEPGTAGDAIIILSTPFIVQSGQQYAFTAIALSGTGVVANLAGFNGNPYAGGNTITETGGAVTNFGADQDFGVTIVENACVIDQDQNNAFANISTTTAAGQTFTACETGYVTHVRANFSGLNNVEFKLQMSAGSNTLSPEYTQDFSADSVGDYLIQLTSPFKVLSGQIYAYTVIANSGSASTGGFNGNPYPGGNTITETGGAVTNYGSDLDFSILTLACTPASAGFTETSTELVATFTDGSQDAVSIEYDFGDGNTSTDPNPTHTYAAPGTYTVCQIANNSCLSDTFCTQVVITCTPSTAGFTANTANDLEIVITDASQDATSVLYDFGDGTTSTDPNPTHIYAVAGTYTVCQISTNSCESDTFCSQEVITCTESVSGFTASVFNGLEITFTDASQDAVSVLYDFGDGNTSTDFNPVHTYAASGVYTVCQTTTNECGSDSSCTQVSVIATGIEDIAGLNTLNISPNPSSGLFLVEVEMESRSQLSLEVYTIQGQKVMDKNVGWVSGTANESIDLSNFSRGIYFLQLQINGEMVTKKLILE